jgi:hypothetical protein
VGEEESAIVESEVLDFENYARLPAMCHTPLRHHEERSDEEPLDAEEIAVGMTGRSPRRHRDPSRFALRMTRGA